jgi:hypothetical protein
MPTSAALPQSLPAAVPAPIPNSAILPASLTLLGVGAAILSQAASSASRAVYRNPVINRPSFPSPAIPGTLPVTLSPAVPGLGSITLPGIGPSPNPLTNPATLPLTSFNPAVAQSPAQDLDRQCRERAKRKRKKREPRNVCYRGTFTETKRSTRKVRKEKIPCQ